MKMNLTSSVLIGEGKQNTSNKDHHRVRNWVTNRIQELHEEDTNSNTEKHKQENIDCLDFASFSLCDLEQAEKKKHEATSKGRQ